MSKTRGLPEVLVDMAYRHVSTDSKHSFEDPSAAQQRFLSLFLRSEGEVFRYVAALVPNVTDAQDIVQQTALTLWEKFGAYDPAQPFTPWACRFALNKARQWIERRQRWQALLDHGLAEELAQRRQEPQPEFERRLKHLEGCLEKLPPAQRSLAEAYYYKRTDVESLAAGSGRTVAATYKMLPRIGSAGLGNWNAGSGPDPAPFLIRNLSGSFDEFGLFSRALSDPEVRDLYANGRPYP